MFQLQEEIVKLSDCQKEASLSEKQIQFEIKKLIKVFGSTPEAILDNQNFADVKVIFESLSKLKDKESLLEVLLVSLNNGLSATNGQEIINRTLYFIYWMIFCMEKEKLYGKEDMNLKSRILESFLHLLNGNLSAIFDSPPEKEAIVSVMNKVAFTLFESAENVKILKKYCFDIIGHSVKTHGYLQGCKVSILQCLKYFEHIPEVIAEMLHYFAIEFDITSPIEGILQVISKDLSGSKININFLMKLSELAPKEVLKQISSFNEYLENDPYSQRCCFLEMLKNILLGYLMNEKTENSKNQIKSFFRIFEARFLDVNSFVRSKNLMVLEELCKKGSIPIDRKPQIISLTKDRLYDKSSTVRKRSIQLLIEMILTHPFNIDGGVLSMKFFEDKLKEINMEIQALAPPEIKQILESEEAPSADVVNYDSQDDNKLGSLLLLKKYYSDGIAFVKQISEALDVVFNLLCSVNKTEVIEAMDFIITCHFYKIEAAKIGLRKMVHLIWSKDTTYDEESKRTVRENLLIGFSKLFFNFEGTTAEKTSLTVKALIEFVEELNLAEMTSFEQMIAVLTDKNLFSASCIQLLWQIFYTSSSASKTRRSCIVILSFMAKSRKEIVEDKLDVLLSVGLGDFGASDWISAKFTLIALQRLVEIKRGKGIASDYQRLPWSHVIFSKTIGFLKDCCIDEKWLQVIEQGINTIYLLADKPDKLMQDFIKTLINEAFNLYSMEEEEKAINILSLSKLLFVVGHVAIKQVIHLEYIEQQWKQQQQQQSSSKKEEKKGPMTPLRKKRLSMMITPEGSSIDELQEIAGSADDEFADLVFYVREHEILFGKTSLISLFHPIIEQICLNDTVFNDKTLLSIAHLTLCKFMTVSSEFCEKNLKLLLTVLEKSKVDVIRSNSIIAMGDVAMCFNNLIDQNIEFLYKRLQDSDKTVKKNSLMVLSHLILNGMIKVKGQISEIAKCLEDADVQIRDLARLFFTELSGKDNAIYNLLPDIISSLSCSSEFDKFQSVMKFIFSFIKKDKQSDAMADKLCQRFKASDNVKHWRDMAFCLSLLPLNSEKVCKRIIENFSLYESKLADAHVYECFSEIFAKMKKLAKMDLKPLLDEYEQLLIKTFKKYNEDCGAENESVSVQTMTAKLKDLKIKKKTRKAAFVDDDEEERKPRLSLSKAIEDEEEEEIVSVRSTRSRSGRRLKKAVLTDGEEEEDLTEL